MLPSQATPLRPAVERPPPVEPRPAPAADVGTTRGIVILAASDADAAVLATPDQADTSIAILARRLNRPAFADAVLPARQRGVMVLLDTGRCEDAAALREAGTAVRVDTAHRPARRTVILIDGEIVIAGSFPITAAAPSDRAGNVLTARHRP